MNKYKYICCVHRPQASPALGPRPPNLRRWSEITDERPAARFRGNANNSNCSRRYLNANNPASNTNRYYAGSAQDKRKKEYRSPLSFVPRSGEVSIRQAHVPLSKEDEMRGGHLHTKMAGVDKMLEGRVSDHARFSFR